ncbi:MAG: sugar phosphate isomerase/epimerase [Paenibacillus sp.]|nr:sugar phosphate isomerase/epimerase [Paenibacillus sp.]
MNNICFGSWAFAFGPFAKEPWELPRILQWGQEAGYDGIELNGFRPHPHPDDYDTAAKCDKLVREIEHSGLKLVGYAPDLTGAPPAIVEAELYMKELRKCLDFCANCGVRTLRIDTVSPPEPLNERVYAERFSRLAGTWQLAAEEADRRGVRIVWEFEPGFWLNKPSEVKRILDTVDHPHFLALFDSCHAYMGAVQGARHVGSPELLAGGVAEYWSMLAPRIGHLHLIDSDGTLHDEDTSTHTHFGQGHLDFAALLATAKPFLATNEWIGVDYCFNADAAECGKEAPAFIRRYLGEDRR